MRRRTLFIIVPALCGILLAGFLLLKKIAEGGFEKELIPAFTESSNSWNNIRGPYIFTRWKQDGDYAAFTPDHELLGCWSIAFAQVLAFHRLSPSGEVDYITTGGLRINQDLNDVINWERIIPSIDNDTLPETSQEVAKYCFNVAAVLQKDFGTGEYKDISIVPQEISDHYKCVVNKVTSDLATKIKTEIYAGRPVIAYLNDILAIKIVRNGHAIVIDGTAENNIEFYVHLNCGWGGDSDGWYEYNSLAAQRKLLYIFTVMPV